MAGFNKAIFPNLRDIIMVTEPEAAAIYTARYLKEDTGREFLKASSFDWLSEIAADLLHSRESVLCYATPVEGQS
jgi:hypothetical protein